MNLEVVAREKPSLDTVPQRPAWNISARPETPSYPSGCVYGSSSAKRRSPSTPASAARRVTVTV